MARMELTVHSAVEMLCAPRALQMVTCGPTTCRESTPCPPSARAPGARRADAARCFMAASDRVRNPDVDVDLVVRGESAAE
jgi:hypothetical protein